MFINGRNTLYTHIKTEVTEIIQIPVHPKKGKWLFIWTLLTLWWSVIEKKPCIIYSQPLTFRLFMRQLIFLFLHIYRIQKRKFRGLLSRSFLHGDVECLFSNGIGSIYRYRLLKEEEIVCFSATLPCRGFVWHFSFACLSLFSTRRTENYCLLRKR